MTFQKPNSGGPAKGQVKCFQCRQACLLKDGGWHSKDNAQTHQVFLCKNCENAALGRPSNSPFRAK